MTDREQFEAWARKQPWIKDCQRYTEGEYGHYETEKAWSTWQAARTQPAQVPRLTDEEIMDAWEDAYEPGHAQHELVRRLARRGEAALIAKWSKT